MASIIARLTGCFYGLCCTYKTAKMVKVTDRKVVMSHHILVGAILIYVIHEIIRQMRYCRVVSILGPDYGIMAYWNEGDWSKAHATSLAEDPAFSQLSYCNGEIDMNHWYSPSWQYINNTCSGNYTSGDLHKKTDNMGLRANHAMGVYDSGHKTSDIVPFVELLNFSYTVDLKVDGKEWWMPETWFLKNDNWEKVREEKDVNNTEFMINVGDLFSWTGHDYDERNVQEYGLIDVPLDSNGAMIYPEYGTYRLTGVKHTINMDISNMDHQDYQTPWDLPLINKVTITSDTGMWNCRGFEYVKPGDEMVHRYTCGTSIQFNVGGNMCFFDWNTLLGEIASLIVLVSVAAIVVDFLCSSMFSWFSDAKNVDEHNAQAANEIHEVREGLEELNKNFLKDQAFRKKSSVDGEELGPWFQYLDSMAETVSKNYDYYGNDTSVEERLRVDLQTKYGLSLPQANDVICIIKLKDHPVKPRERETVCYNLLVETIRRQKTETYVGDDYKVDDLFQNLQVLSPSLAKKALEEFPELHDIADTLSEQNAGVKRDPERAASQFEPGFGDRTASQFGPGFSDLPERYSTENNDFGINGMDDGQTIMPQFSAESPSYGGHVLVKSNSVQSTFSLGTIEDIAKTYRVQQQTPDETPPIPFKRKKSVTFSDPYDVGPLDKRNAGDHRESTELTILSRGDSIV